jgi:hypothetical protein
VRLPLAIIMTPASINPGPTKMDSTGKLSPARHVAANRIKPIATRVLGQHFVPQSSSRLCPLFLFIEFRFHRRKHVMVASRPHIKRR